MADRADTPDADTHRTMAAEANNTAWEYLTKAELTDDEIDQLLERGYAAAYHWRLATPPGAIQRARAAWLLSRIHVVVGQPELAMRYAERCAALTLAAGDAAADFDHGYALEATARAHAAAGDDEEAAAVKAKAAAVQIAGEEDRSIFESDLADGPWFGVG